MWHFRIDVLQGAVGAYCVLAGLLMLMEPHRLARLAAFATLQPHLHWAGALFLLCGVVMIAGIILPLTRRYQVAIHLATCVALLQIAAGYFTTRTWTGSIAYAVLAGAVAVAPWLASDRHAPSVPGRPPHQLLSAALAVVLLCTGLLMLIAPDEFDAPNFVLLRPWLGLIGMMDLIGGLALVAVLIWPVPLVTFRVVHVLAGAGMMVYVFLAPLYNRNPVALAYYAAFWLPLMATPWLRWTPRRDGSASLGAILALVLSVVAAAPTIAGFVVDAARDDADARQDALDELQDDAYIFSQTVAGALSTQRTVAVTLASSIELLELPTDQVDQRLAALVLQQPDILALSAFRPDGTPLGRSDGAPPRPPRGFPAFETTVSTQTPTTVLQRSASLGRMIVVTTAPMFDASGALIGVTAASIEPSRLLLPMEAARMRGAEILLVDDLGHVVASADPSQTGLPSTNPTVAAARSQSAEAGTLVQRVTGDERMTAYRRIPDAGWIIVVERSAGAMLADAYAHRDRLFVYLLLAIIAAILGGVVLARRLSAPLVDLATAVGRFGRGEVVPLPASSVSEAAQLAAAFEDARARLVARTAERERAEAEVHALNRDLEERVRQRTAALVAASQVNQRLAAIVASSDDAILSKSLDGIVLSWNPAAERLYGYAADEMIGQSLEVLFPTDRRYELTELLHRIRRGESVKAFDTIRLHKDGRQLDVSVRVSLIRDEDGQVVGASAIARDLTAERLHQRREAQLEKVRALGQMAGGIAHDLNQSLSLIAGYGELVEEALANQPREVISANIPEMLQTVRRAALDGGETVARLLRFARGGSDDASRLSATVDIRPLLEDVAQLTAPRWRDSSQAEGRPIRLEIDCAPGMIIRGDPGSLREALTNLVFNAVDAMPSGGQIRLSARSREHRVVVEVEDQGQGMSDDVRDRIFEPFFTTKGERGTGLGLAMVQSIIERHDGSISVDSEPGRGTRFMLDLPLAPSGTTVVVADGTRSVPGRSLRILVVDDQEGITTMAAMMLSAYGHTATEALSGESALALLESHTFDLVISDLAMGDGINGWQLASQIRERWPSVRVVLATGWGATIDAREARHRGVAGVLKKPYRSADLLSVISAAM